MKSVEHAEKEKRNACQERDELAQCLEETEQMVENTEQALSKLNNEMLDMFKGSDCPRAEKKEEKQDDVPSGPIQGTIVSRSDGGFCEGSAQHQALSESQVPLAQIAKISSGGTVQPGRGLGFGLM